MQVMQMDIAGFAISAGPACSSGTTRTNKALIAMGYESQLADCAVRVSIGTETTKSQVKSFAKQWAEAHSKRNINVA
jgi:cysteine desulfurase